MGMYPCREVFALAVNREGLALAVEAGPAGGGGRARRSRGQWHGQAGREHEAPGNRPEPRLVPCGAAGVMTARWFSPALPNGAYGHADDYQGEDDGDSG